MPKQPRHWGSLLYLCCLYSLRWRTRRRYSVGMMLYTWRPPSNNHLFEPLQNKSWTHSRWFRLWFKRGSLFLNSKYLISVNSRLNQIAVLWFTFMYSKMNYYNTGSGLLYNGICFSSFLDLPQSSLSVCPLLWSSYLLGWHHLFSDSRLLWFSILWSRWDSLYGTFCWLFVEKLHISFWWKNKYTAVQERFLEKVNATILKGIVGGFELTVFQRNLKEWLKRPWTHVCKC